MATTIAQILMRRGPAATLPTLADGEIGLCTDTGALYIGTPSGNEQINPPGGSSGGTGGGTSSGLTLNPRGAWDSSLSYVPGDLVTYGGGSWLAVADSTGTTPTDTAVTPWLQLAAPGQDGAAGPPGAPGAAGAPGAPGTPGTNAEPSTRITLTLPDPFTEAASNTAFLFQADFSASGVFDDECCAAVLQCSAQGVVIHREDNKSTSGIAAWTVQCLSTYQGSPGYGNELVFTLASVKNTGWTGSDTLAVAATWTWNQVI